jgi:two-component system sensor histidine kinase EvgS
MSIQHNHQGKLVLVVEDDADMRAFLRDVLQELGLHVTETIDRNRAIQQMMAVDPHIVLADLPLLKGGIEHVNTLRAFYPSCPIILLAAPGDDHAKADAVARGVQALLIKPVGLATLQRAIIGVLDGEWEPHH